MNINSLLYLHRDTLASREIKDDVDFLVDLLAQEGIKKKRWEVYLDEGEEMLEDGEAHSHASLLEHLAYKETMIEGLEEEKALLLMWAARFHGLGEADHVRKNIQSKLVSEYAKEMLEKVLLIYLDKRNLENDAFDYVDFFDSLKRRRRVSTALGVIEKKAIADWNSLLANVLFNEIMPLIEHGKKYRSAEVYLKKNGKLISYALDNHFAHEHVQKSFERIYEPHVLVEKKKSLDISPEKIQYIKKSWKEFIRE